MMGIYFHGSPKGHTPPVEHLWGVDTTVIVWFFIVILTFLILARSGLDCRQASQKHRPSVCSLCPDRDTDRDTDRDRVQLFRLIDLIEIFFIYNKYSGKDSVTACYGRSGAHLGVFSQCRPLRLIDPHLTSSASLFPQTNWFVKGPELAEPTFFAYMEL